MYISYTYCALLWHSMLIWAISDCKLSPLCLNLLVQSYICRTNKATPLVGLFYSTRNLNFRLLWFYTHDFVEELMNDNVYVQCTSWLLILLTDSKVGKWEKNHSLLVKNTSGLPVSYLVNSFKRKSNLLEFCLNCDYCV